jgi:hypothetical protein
MSDNPYEPPQAAPEPGPKPWRRSITMVALTVLTVPAAAIAGGGTCLGGVRLLYLGSIGVGVAVMTAVLAAGHYWLSRSSERRVRYNFHLAGYGFMISTPPALICAFLLGVHGYDVSNGGGDGTPYIFAGAFTAFLLWSLGAWTGLRWDQ